MRRRAPKSQRIAPVQDDRKLQALRDELLTLQAQLRKTEHSALAVLVTGIPAAGRSETVNQLLEWLDPKYVAVHAFGEPDRLERLYPPLWRYWRKLPARGRIAFYFAGWYGDYMSHVLHEAQGGSSAAKRAMDRILQLESMLNADGVRVLKIHLHIDRETQRRRLRTLSASKLTRWRVTDEDRWFARHHDLANRAIARCQLVSDHAAAPWNVIDGTDEQHRVLRAGEILRDELRKSLQAVEPAPASSAKRAAAASGHKQGAMLKASPAPKLAGDDYDSELERLQARLALQVRRSEFRKHGLVLAFEGMDAAGKGGAIRRVTHAFDARQYQVIPVGAPTEQERSYPYLWRFWQALPELGHIAIFDRSWYGRVLVERVRGFARPAHWQRAYAEIAEFERQLVEHGLILAKFWLQVSRDEQLERFRAREDNPLKRFKVDPEDWVNRRHYDDYQVAAAEMIERTDAKQAKWTVVDADSKKRARLHVLRTVCEEIERRLR